jgi:hypothetical protein
MWLPVGDTEGVSVRTQAHSGGHVSRPKYLVNLPICNKMSPAPRLLSELALLEAIVESLLQFLVVVGGLMFSLATAILIEELIFGRIFRVVFARRPEPSNPGQKQ